MIGLILIVFVFVIVILFIKCKSKENFTALSGLNPLTSYDDYGTFNFILHTDDMPYYDKGFASIFCGKPDYVKEKPKPGGSVNPAADWPEWDTTDLKPYFNFDSDSFIDYIGYKVRRDLVPSNYADHMLYGRADFKTDQILINKMRPKESLVAPQPHNYYFVQPEKKYKPLF